MTYHGHIENGMIVLDDVPQYPDGTQVEVALTVLPSGSASEERTMGSLYERWESFIGIAQELPEDFATNHDYYAHGGSKR